MTTFTFVPFAYKDTFTDEPVVTDELEGLILNVAVPAAYADEANDVRTIRLLASKVLVKVRVNVILVTPIS